jgi:hypothetical protein
VSDWSFEVVDARAEPYAAVPTLVFRLKIGSADDLPVHAIALRAQIRIEPQRRRYAPAEVDRLFELFGDAPQWADSLKPLLWTHTSLIVPAFDGRTEIDVPVACTYDFEVGAAKYLHALDEGDIPLIFLFSGTIFAKAPNGFSVEQVPWDREAPFRLPVRVWRTLMDQYFPGSAWIRLRRENFDALHRFKGRGAFPTWDAAVEALLAGVEARSPS